MDQVLVTYKNTTLYKSDWNLLDHGGWMNDKLIGFYFEWLEQFHHEGSVCFVNPSTVFLAAQLDEESLVEMIGDLNLDSKALIFIPVNDHQDVEKSGGSHWSLLVFCRPTAICYYFDSSHGSNKKSAMEIFYKFKPLFKCEAAQVEEQPTPQQPNGYDCGVYVMSFTEYIANAFTAKEKLRKGVLQSWMKLIRKMESEITSSTVTDKRLAIREIIGGLQKQRIELRKSAKGK